MSDEFSTRDRAAEKTASRADDAASIASGEKTRDELARENCPFATLVRRVNYDATGLPSYRKTKDAP